MMKSFKKKLAVVLALTCMIGSIPVYSFAEEDGMDAGDAIIEEVQEDIVAEAADVPAEVVQEAGVIEAPAETIEAEVADVVEAPADEAIAGIEMYAAEPAVEDDGVVVEDIEVIDDYSYYEEDVPQPLAEKEIVARIGDANYETLQDAVEAAVSGDVIEIEGNCVVNDQIVIDKDVTINLNGYTIYNEELIYGGSAWSLISVQAGTLVISGDGAFQTRSDDKIFSIDVRNGAYLVVNGGSYTGYDSAIYIATGYAEINGGNFSCAPGRYGYQLMINADEDAGGSFIVNGGTFYGWNVVDENGTDWTAEDKHAHELSEGVWTVEDPDWVLNEEESIAPTCIAEGEDVYCCTKCDATYTEIVPIDPDAHKYTSEVILEPTCTEEGIMKYTCELCGDWYVEPMEELGHDYEEKVIHEPTCTKDGMKVQECTRCGWRTDEELIEALGHDYEETVIEEPSCTEDGLAEYVCSRCKDSYEEVIPAFGHTRVIVPAVEPTCTEDGQTAYEMCEICGYVIIEPNPVKALGHDYKLTETKEATCTKDGGKTYTCSRCGDTYTDVIKATGHKAVTDKAVAATCTKDGLTEGSHCSVCGEILTAQKTVKAKGHTVVTDKAVAATCTKDGLTEGSHCSVCGAVLTAQKTVKAKGHSYQWVVDKAADYGIEGSRHQVCSVCGARGKTETIAAKRVGTLVPRINKTTKKAQTLKWNSLKGATSYNVYGSKCSGSYKLLTTTTGTKFKVTNLKKGTSYKYYVEAYNGDTKIATSYTIHGVTNGSAKYSNPTDVTVNKTSVSMSKGDTKQIKAVVTAEGKVLQHTRELRYYSSNKNIATVNKNGVITAVGTGGCKIYVVAQNGIGRKINVTVK